MHFHYGFRICRTVPSWSYYQFDQDLEDAFRALTWRGDLQLFGEDIVSTNRPEIIYDNGLDSRNYVAFDHYAARTPAGALWLQLNLPQGAEELTSFTFLQEQCRD